VGCHSYPCLHEARGEDLLKVEGVGSVLRQRGRCDKVDTRSFEGPVDMLDACLCKWKAVADEGCGFVRESLAQDFLGGHYGKSSRKGLHVRRQIGWEVEEQI